MVDSNKNETNMAYVGQMRVHHKLELNQNKFEQNWNRSEEIMVKTE